MQRIAESKARCARRRTGPSAAPSRIDEPRFRPRLLEIVAPVPPADLRERQLAERLVQGDEAALREAYGQYASAVFGLAVRVLANESLAEDVTQEVFVRLWERPERFDADRGSLRSFVLAMAHSRAVERVRSEEARRRRHQNEQQQQRVSADTDPAGLLADRATAQAVREALSELPQPERLPIELAYFGGMSYRQVAEHLGEPVGTIKYRIRCGMQKMRAALRAVEVSP
jgi:RNA polymerase sigma-70 factor, ECF subfamily